MTTTEWDADLRRLETLTHWMDDRFRIPGTGFRFGLDGLLGLVPGVGDGATWAATVYMIAAARRLGAPKRLVARMIGNGVVDLLVGLVPLVGDLFDFGFKANRRNLTLLKAWMAERQATAATAARESPATAAGESPATSAGAGHGPGGAHPAENAGQGGAGWTPHTAR